MHKWRCRIKYFKKCDNCYNNIYFRYGSRISATAGYIYALRPSADLWTRTLLRQTQILYSPDCSLILTLLDVRPGAVLFCLFFCRFFFFRSFFLFFKLRSIFLSIFLFISQNTFWIFRLFARAVQEVALFLIFWH